MYTLLSKSKTQDLDYFPINESSAAANIPSEFLSHAVFAGDSFWELEAAYGRVDGVVRTVAGYCGGTINKPAYREVCEGITGHTESVKITYDQRVVSYRSLCDAFWGTHDPTNKKFLNFGIVTHLRSVIFYSTEEQRKQAQESKIRHQMKLNKRIVTKIEPLNNDFFISENCHQKYYLQKHCRLCGSLGLRSTEHFAESEIACKLNGILALSGELIVEKLETFFETHQLLNQSRLACEEIIENFKADTNLGS